MSQTKPLAHEGQAEVHCDAEQLGVQANDGSTPACGSAAGGEQQQQLQPAWGTKKGAPSSTDLRLIPDTAPGIHSKRDLTILCEVEDAMTGAFLRSTYGYIDSSDSAWFGRMPGVRKYDLTVEDLRRTLQRIPDENIYPEVTPDVTIAQVSKDDSSVYIKRPQLTGCDDPDVAALLPRLLSGEVEVLEFLKARPHPNLVTYYGCTLKDGRVTGIALEKHDILLLYRYRDRPLPFDIAACMDGIRAGVRHLHALGFAHNDLNPMNILLNKDDRPVIIDFGSCRRFGEQLISAGTPGWIDEEYIFSALENDEAALRKIAAWLAASEKDWSRKSCEK